jgi:DNA-binding NarL/FixJ family response regulator
MNDRCVARLVDLIRVLNVQPAHGFIQELHERIRLLQLSPLQLAGRASVQPDQGEFTRLWMELRSFVRTKTKRQYHLSSSEEKVLACLLLNLRDKEIAAAIGLRTSTVKTHIHHLFRKFATHSRQDLLGELLGHTLQPSQSESN